MKIWLDAQISPQIAKWLSVNFSIEAVAVRDLGLRDASDENIFFAAKSAGAILLSKDSDFIDLVERFEPPPQIIWLTCGNTSNENLKRILSVTIPDAISLLERGDVVVEIADT